MSYQVNLYISTVVCLRIVVRFTYTSGGGEVTAYFIIVKPKLTRNLGLLDILGFVILLPHGGTKP